MTAGREEKVRVPIVQLCEGDGSIDERVDDEQRSIAGLVIFEDDAIAIVIRGNHFDVKARTLFIVHSKKCSMFLADRKETRLTVQPIDIANTHRSFFQIARPVRHDLNARNSSSADELLLAHLIGFDIAPLLIGEFGGEFRQLQFILFEEANGCDGKERRRTEDLLMIGVDGAKVMIFVMPKEHVTMSMQIFPEEKRRDERRVFADGEGGLTR